MDRQIDYSDTQLSDAELAEQLERERQEQLAEAEAEKRRQAKMRAFRFVGGMF